MPITSQTDLNLKLDADGFLLDFASWNHEVACALAESIGVGACDLTPARIRILEFLRDYYQEFEAFPVVGYVCKSTDQPRACLYEEFIDPIRAWKIAGLPKPTTEVLANVPHHESTLSERRPA
jgi:tRNA 2-thiouridine synthesizing protein E